MKGTMSVNGKIIWTYTPKQLKEMLSFGDKGQLYFANLCKKYMDRYVPMRSGVLKNTAKTVKEGVLYNTPYAHRQYSHDEYHHTDGRTAHWDAKMVDIHKNDIIKAMADYCQGGIP